MNVKDIAEISATSGGNVSSDGGSTVPARGICWGTLPNPTVSDFYTSEGNNTGSFTSKVVGLNAGTLYYLRAYATNNSGTFYGQQLSFTTLSPGGGAYCQGIATVNYGGQTYNTVQIGPQCWLRENLNFGTRIDELQNQADNNVIEKHCFSNLESNCEIYGGYYQWDEMMQYSNYQSVMGICPEGWHIPSEAEWDVLAQNLGGSSQAGMRMKEFGTAAWDSNNTDGTNESGFTALGGGKRWRTAGPFEYTGIESGANFWTSSEGFSLSLFSASSGLTVSQAQNNSSSVRCLKNL